MIFKIYSGHFQNLLNSSLLHNLLIPQVVVEVMNGGNESAINSADNGMVENAVSTFSQHQLPL